MSDPLRSKLKIVAYTSIALVLALGLASGFRWVKGGDVINLAAAQPELVPSSTTASSNAEPTEQGTIPASYEALAEASRALVGVVDAVKPAVVSISSFGTLQRQRLPRGFEDLFGETHPEVPDSPFDAPLGRGSGFVVSEDGLIMTNNHVVAMAERIEVELADGRVFPGELVGRDPTTDIALVRIDATGLQAVKFGDPDQTAVGEFVVAIGNPGTALGSELPFTVTAGIVSAKGRNTNIIQQSARSNYAIEDMIQTDAVINPGNSGGPLVNYRGEVIGINTAIQSTTGFYQGYGFAIPVSLAQDVMEDLLEYGHVRRAALRVSVTAPSRDDAKAFGLPNQKGAIVQDFPPSSPAERAGIQPGDVIVAINGRAVERVGQLQRTVASYEPGEKVDVEVIRFGKRMIISVKLAEAEIPQIESAPVEVASRPGDMLIGVEVSEVSPRLFQQNWEYVPSDAVKGVMVTNVKRFGPAWNAQLGPPWLIQSVNGMTIESVEDFDNALSKVEPGDVVTIQAVIPDGDGGLQHRFFNMTVPERD
jgi:serine protease Do